MSPLGICALVAGTLLVLVVIGLAICTVLAGVSNDIRRVAVALERDGERNTALSEERP